MMQCKIFTNRYLIEVQTDVNKFMSTLKTLPSFVGVTETKTSFTITIFYVVS